MKTAFNKGVLSDPNYAFSVRTDNIRDRILVLQQDLSRMQSYISCAIIETEIELLVDDYIERTQIIKHKNENDENEDK